MKNPTILKDELGLLKADMSAVLKELNAVGDQLKDAYIRKQEANNELAEVKNTILEEIARLDDLRGRAILVNKDLIQYTQDLRNMKNSWESARIKNAQEVKLHLGRIKDLEARRQDTEDRIAVLKDTYDNNLRIYNQSEEERKTKLKALNEEIKTREKEVKEVLVKLTKNLDEDKKITKERLKREDKIRARENYLVAKEESMNKKAEDLVNMSLDLAIIYGRLKTLYEKVDPAVDLDRLVIQVK